MQVDTELPLTTLRRFLATCSRELTVASWFPGHYSLGRLDPVGFRVLSQIAQSELIKNVRIECEHAPQIDTH